MKNWAPSKGQAVLPSIPMPLPSVPMTFECIGCSKYASLLYEGSSFCRGCLQEKLRLGR